MAAALLNIPYEGLAFNAHHAEWLGNIMDQTIFSILQERVEFAGTKKRDESAEDKNMREECKMYFAHLIESGRQYLEEGTEEDSNCLMQLDHEDDNAEEEQR